jgi:hypothetical protein
MAQYSKLILARTLFMAGNATVAAATASGGAPKDPEASNGTAAMEDVLTVSSMYKSFQILPS